MDLQEIKKKLVSNVYHIKAKQVVALHKHPKNDEIFYCIKGEGFGVLENEEVELAVGKAFIVPAGVMHSIRTDSNLYVSSFIIPVINDSEE